MALITGSRVGPYEIVEFRAWLCGVGGEAYRARDTRDENLDKDLELRVLHLDLTAPDVLARFERESKASQALSHPNISTIQDFGTQDGFAYLVIELLEGETLGDRLKAGAIPQKLAVDYMLQVAKGLSAGHERGVINGDLQPANLFITKDGQVKIHGFGRGWLKTSSDDPESDMLLGTPGYISPEQIRGKPAGARSDIFSFGAILYEMLAGKRAFPGDNWAEILAATLKRDPPDLFVATQGVSPDLERLVRHCLEKDPELRFQSVRHLESDLGALSDLSAVTPVRRPWWRRIKL